MTITDLINMLYGMKVRYGDDLSVFIECDGQTYEPEAAEASDQIGEPEPIIIINCR